MARRLGLVAMGAALFVAALDAYVVASVLPRMINDFAIPLDHLERATPIVSLFLVGYVAAMPLVAGLADARGHAVVFAACLVVFAAGSIVTATSHDLTRLVAGRFLQGAAGGAMVPVAFATAVGGTTRRGLLRLGYVVAAQEVGSLFGPVYGAVITRLDVAGLGWRTVFWLNVPLAALCLLALFLAATRRSSGGDPQPDDGERWDWLSALFLGVSLGALVFALYPSDAAHRAFNPSHLALATLGVAAIVFFVFAWRVARSHTSAFLDWRDIGSVQLGGTLLTNALVGMALVAAVVEVPLLAQTVLNLDETGSAALLAWFLAGIPVGAIAGAAVARFGALRPVIVAGLGLAAGGFVLLARWNPPSPLVKIAVTGGIPGSDVVLFATGLGFGLVIAPLVAAVVTRTGPHRHATAAALVVQARMLGMVVGFAALSAYGLNRFYVRVNSGPTINPVVGSPDFFQQAAALQARYTAALLDEYHQIFLVAAGICVIAAAIAAVTPISRRLVSS